MINLKTKVAGYYKIEARKKDGSNRVLADWFPNLITNQGLDRIGASSDYLNYCHVGSGSTAPAVTDTGLVTHVAQTSTVESESTGNSGASPYYSYNTRVFSFGEGVAEGNLTEVGIGWSASTGNLFSRALILDGVGSPTTITVLSDEYLYVTYQFRRYIPEVDTGDTVVIASVTYTFVGRAAHAATEFYWPAYFRAITAPIDPNCRAYDGSIGIITSDPSGSTSGTGDSFIAAYNNGNYYIDWTYTFGLTQGNLSGISALKVGMCGAQYQFGITPDIPKTSDDVLTLTFRASWDRT